MSKEIIKLRKIINTKIKVIYQDFKLHIGKDFSISSCVICSEFQAKLEILNQILEITKKEI